MAQAALQDRDLNGEKVTDDFCDTDLNITWLRDANVIGQMSGDAAVSRAGAYSFGGYRGWRLPTNDTCHDYNCTGSEMGHLWYVELGKPAGGPMTNTGDFRNLQSKYYGSGTKMASSGYACAFNTDVGSQGGGSFRDALLAMASHLGMWASPCRSLRPTP